MVNISAEYWAVIVAALAFAASNVWKSIEYRKAARAAEASHKTKHIKLDVWAENVDKRLSDFDRKFEMNQQDIRAMQKDLQTVFKDVRDLLKRFILSQAKKGLEEVENE